MLSCLLVRVFVPSRLQGRQGTYRPPHHAVFALLRRVADSIRGAAILRIRANAESERSHHRVANQMGALLSEKHKSRMQLASRCACVADWIGVAALVVRVCFAFV